VSLLKRMRPLIPSWALPRSRILPSKLRNPDIARYAGPGGPLRMGRTPTWRYASHVQVVSVYSLTFPVDRIHIAHASRVSAPVE
jgi:hypothetical protein